MGQTMGFSAKEPVDEDAASGIGPRGLGDPNDLSLRDREMLVSIPNYQRQAAEYSKCKHLWNEYEECADSHFFPAIHCKSDYGKYADCINFWSHDSQYREEIAKEYLEVRQEYRKTGRRRLYRALKGETYITKSQLEGVKV